MEINKIQYLSIQGNCVENRILIFLPGLGAFKENYIAYSLSLVNLYKFIFILDLPEQGSKGNWTIGSMVDNLKEFIKEKEFVSIKEIHLEGHSAGALAILSFMYNYNIEVENYLMYHLNKERSKKSLFDSVDMIGFCKSFPEKEKVTKLTLFAPVDLFDIVLSTGIIKFLSKINGHLLKLIFNVMVNIPMLIVNKVGRYKDVKFKLNKKCNLQYFGLETNNTDSFFDYVTSYTTIFQLFKCFSNDEKHRISRVLNKKQVLIHFGKFDWLLKSLKRSKNQMLSNFKLHKDFKIIEHANLGHMLSNKFSLDINLNKQMLTSKSLINNRGENEIS